MTGSAVTGVSYALSARAADFYESTFVPGLSGEWARRLVAAAGVTPGRSVLDVTCGTGVVARTAAERTGPEGSVVGLDRNEAMLDVAHRVRPDLRWQVRDACALPFPDGSFDVVLSQAGLMFFDDRVRALREMGRVAGGAGRIAVQVPGRLARSAGCLALTETVTRHASPDVFDLFSVYFAVGEPDLLTDLFDSAGLHVDRFDTWVGATRLDAVDTFLEVELLPLAGHVEPCGTGSSRTAAPRWTGSSTPSAPSPRRSSCTWSRRTRRCPVNLRDNIGRWVPNIG
ncbi:methyltransferase domain-containing protein [Actinoplanes sp. NPDC051633]|uniref:class I SAM-dependent methyltransferase n=1 Tax=Actinoplanes sp. NPDC051633 TaxID=3155670 RepID=UPI003441D6F2